MESLTPTSEDSGSSEEQWTGIDFRRVGDELGLQSTRTSQRLNQIDRVRANGVGDHVALPQLVVCGDQSAGKSSVLEGISGIPFPRQDGLCTRFATEIVLRHNPHANCMSATIIPHLSQYDEEKRRLAAFRMEFGHFSELPGIIEAAGQVMGVRTSEDQVDAPAFAADVLRLELVGDTGLHLTIVDLPGMISVSEDERDVQMVSDLVDTYLESSRTSVLAVVPASSDVDTQGIIQRARRYDKDGVQTVGIITKPDLINAGTEQRVACLAKNLDRTKLNLGFFLLKNPAPAELQQDFSPAARRYSEQLFFATEPWSSLGLDPARIGIENLRVFLQDLLDNHIERELPKIRVYLTQISADFQALVRAGVDGDYHGRDASFFNAKRETLANRLRALIHQENEKFANYIRDHGQTRKIICDEDDKDDESTSSDGTELSLNNKGQILVSREGMAAWIKQIYQRTRGRELPGNYNHSLLAELFHSQSVHWDKIARDHLNAVAALVSSFLQAALEFVIKDTKVRQNVQNCVSKSVQGDIQRAIEELRVLLEDEARQPITYNHYYTDNIQKARNDQSKREIQDSLHSAIQADWNRKLHINNSNKSIEKLVFSLQQQVIVDVTKQACSEAQNSLSAYYKVAMKTFVDNVCRQVIERHIVAKLPAVFEPVLVSGYEDDDLLRMAAESPRVVREPTRFHWMPLTTVEFPIGAEMEWDKEEDIVVVAVWAKGLTNVYNALDAATTLGYTDTGTDPVRNIWDHRQEFLVDNGITADEYRILAVFEGGGESRLVEFECPLYRIVTVVPNKFFCGRRTEDALADIEDEILYCTGMRDDLKRDELMKAIANISPAPFSFPTIIYQGNKPILGKLQNIQPPGNANYISFHDQLI
ncbi:P-loop containing nucleoside triphosphate hydrolase protein [Aspergillus navahoensis]